VALKDEEKLAIRAKEKVEVFPKGEDNKKERNLLKLVVLGNKNKQLEPNDF
jgi:hypothetical protein